jgi:Mce-associated membrane protein
VSDKTPETTETTETTAPTWYDLLGVERDTGTDEIRTAWKGAVDGLDPTDRRFRSLSDAAAVLLDDERRAAYDATLPADGVVETGGSGVVAPPADAGRSPEASILRRGEAAATGGSKEMASEGDLPAGAVGATTPEPHRRVPLVRGWMLAALGLLAAAAVAAAAVSYTRSPSHGTGGTVVVANDNTSVATSGDSAGKPITYNHTLTVEADGAAALAAAKTAIVPVLSYDYRDMDKSRTAAEAYLTDSYKAEYDKLFAVLAQNAPTTKTVVSTNPPVDAGVVRVSPGQVEVLMFVDRPTTNAQTKKPIDYQDQITVTMQQVDGTWLVNQIQTSPVQP